jgi:hypothetical protein
MSSSRVCIFGKPLPIRKRLANLRGSARHSDRFMSALCADHRQSQPITRSGGPACSNRVALDLTAPVGSMLRCRGRGPYGRPCSQNNQKHHTKSGLWLRSRRNRIAPTSSRGPASASPYEPSRISGRQKSRLSSFAIWLASKACCGAAGFRSRARRPISRLRTCAFRTGRS